VCLRAPIPLSRPLDGTDSASGKRDELQVSIW
jgi:hypothetical protein